MAALTHVCMWTPQGWQRITAAEFNLLHPEGVSARSGLLMCELCGQYVTFAKGENNTPHFRHKSYEDSTDCPERLAINSNPLDTTYDSRQHDLPIRLEVNESHSTFDLKLGLIRAPISDLSDSFRVKIKAQGTSYIPLVFGKEWLNSDSITYLSLDTLHQRPCPTYIISFQNGNDELHDFWPAEVKGIDPQGTLFEKKQANDAECFYGNKLSQDADVEIDKSYYLLEKGYGSYKLPNDNSINHQDIMQKQIDGETWTLSEVSATVISEDSAKFFLKYHARLTEHPLSLQPVWPLFVAGEYITKHNQDSMHVLVRGDVTNVKTFPEEIVHQLNKDTGNNQAKSYELYKVCCTGRQQLISVGRTQALQYTYFWQEPLNQEGQFPEITVTDLASARVDPSESDLPPQNTLLFKSPFDGEIVVLRNDHVVDKRKITANKCTELDGLSYGLSVQVVIGLDVVWQIAFKKPQPSLASAENEILKRIANASGVTIPAPHALRNILMAMKSYPQIAQWIRQCIKSGTINEQAYRSLQQIYLTMPSQLTEPKADHSPRKYS